MKRQSILLIAGSMLAFASCQNEAATTGMSQEQIDSTVNARVEEIRVEMMAKNDSLINELAQWKADSMIAAMKGKPVAKAAPKKPAAKPAATSGVRAEADKPATSDSKWGKEEDNQSKSKWGNQEEKQSKSKWGK